MDDKGKAIHILNTATKLCLDEGVPKEQVREVLMGLTFSCQSTMPPEGRYEVRYTDSDERVVGAVTVVRF